MQLEASFTIVTCLLYRPPIGVRKRQQIIGIVSFGHKCAAVGKPGKTELPQAIPAWNFQLFIAAKNSKIQFYTATRQIGSNMSLCPPVSLSSFLSLLYFCLFVPLSLCLSFSLSSCLSVSLSLCLYVSLSLILPASLSFCLSVSVFPSLHLSVSPSLHLSVSPSLRLSVSLSLHLSVSPSLRLSVSMSLDLSISSFVSWSFLISPLSVSLSLAFRIYISLCVWSSVSQSLSLSPFFTLSLAASVSPGWKGDVCVCVCVVHRRREPGFQIDWHVFHEKHTCLAPFGGWSRELALKADVTRWWISFLSIHLTCQRN